MKIACSKCKVEMRPRMIGVTVVLYDKLKPYRINKADEYFCLECDATIIIDFAKDPIAENWWHDFEDELKISRNHVNGSKLREIYELPQRMINKLKEVKEDGTVSKKG